MPAQRVMLRAPQHIAPTIWFQSVPLKEATTTTMRVGHVAVDEAPLKGGTVAMNDDPFASRTSPQTDRQTASACVRDKKESHKQS